MTCEALCVQDIRTDTLDDSSVWSCNGQVEFCARGLGILVKISRLDSDRDQQIAKKVDLTRASCACGTVRTPNQINVHSGDTAETDRRGKCAVDHLSELQNYCCFRQVSQPAVDLLSSPAALRRAAAGQGV
jgi:hypothetical protein